jgi:DNA repair exonuclease SbcCD ATPase subunit
VIIFKTLTWSNWFSYGENNIIDISKSTLTQVLGPNGSGKSSIPLILEEILYGKNSKGIKKQEVTNRYTSSNIREASLTFSVDSNNYELKLKRNASTTKLTLLKNSIDISSHTSTGTYKQLEEIIGIDFKTFTQLIYQSSKTSLEFLTATDTQRKNFLISLLGLDKYSNLYEVFKNEYRNTSKIVSELEGSCKTINSWLSKWKDSDLAKLIFKEVPEDTTEVFKEKLPKLEHELANIHSINKKRQENNQYKTLLKNLDLSILSEVPEEPTSIQSIVSERDSINKKIKEVTARGKQLSGLTDPFCPTCKQEIDHDLRSTMLTQWREEISEMNTDLKVLEEKIKEHRVKEAKYKKYKEVSEEFEKLNLLIDKDLPPDLIDEDKLRTEIKDLKDLITKITANIKTVIDYNRKIEEHNARVDLTTSQIDQYKNELNLETIKLKDSEELKHIYDILRQSFSTNGLVSYKIEYLIKDLEEEINNYLNEFSAGRFQLVFNLKDEKLNIEIVDNGNTIDISALSSGELARVNISTLLAIRKLMSSISSTKINLLFLDEIMGVLDSHGKDKLIEVLLEEMDLNTFLVSHEYTHPLLDKITVIKEGKISRIEYG